MSDAPVQTESGLEAQPPLPVRRLHNFIYCPRLFYFQWVENIFQENADTVAGSHAHRNVDAPSKLEDAKELGLPEGTKIRSLKLESDTLGLVGAVQRDHWKFDWRGRNRRPPRDPINADRQ